MKDHDQSGVRGKTNENLKSLLLKTQFFLHRYRLILGVLMNINKLIISTHILKILKCILHRYSI